MSSVKYNQAVNKNLKVAIPTAALASLAIGGAAAQPARSESLSSRAAPQVRKIESFDWLKKINWADELKNLIRITTLDLHTKPAKPNERHLTPAQQAARLVSPAEWVRLDRVHNCENYWTYNADVTPAEPTAYSGGYDIEEANWVANGGLKWAINPAKATHAEQALVVRDIVYSFSYTIPQSEWIKYGGLKYAKSFSTATGDERRAVEEVINPGALPDQVPDAPCQGY